MKQSSKNLLLVLAFLLIGFLAYRYAFARTLEVKNRLEELEKKLGKNSSGVNQNALKNNIAYLDSIITQNRNSEISLQNSLLKVLNQNSDLFSYKIMEFKEPHTYTPPNSINTTNSFEFTLEGNYKNIEQILYALEKDYSFGSFAHINFKKEKDHRQNKFYLQARVLIQNRN